MSLYQKHRPKKFEDLIGNTSTIKAIRRLVESGDVPDVMMFHGSHGSGKTTLARIIPRILGINQMDIKELNNADLRGIDNVRDLKENSVIKPFNSPYKFYILDEFHQATADAKSAALKWMEDTPKHVKIIICTTEAGKLPGTTKSRCVPFRLDPLSDKDIKLLLNRVIKKEKADVDEEVIDKIVSVSEGIPRQALVYLESIINMEGKEALSVISGIGANNEEMKQLFKCLLSNTPWGNYCTVLKGLKEEPETIRRAVLGYMTAIMLNQINGKKGFLNRLAAILEIFENNWYDSGRAGLVKACYEVHCLGDK